MDRSSDENPFDVLADVERVTRQAIAGELSRAEFLSAIATALDHMLRADSAVLDDVGPYFPPAIDVIAAALGHVLENDTPLDATQYRAFHHAISTAVRRAHLPRAVDETADQLRRARLLPPDWRRPSVPGGKPVEVPSLLRGEFVDETPASRTGPEPSSPEPSPMAAATRPRSRGAPVWAQLQLLGVGWVVVLSIVGGALLGLWVDGQFGTSPFGVLIGLALGLLIAYRTVRMMVRQASPPED